MSKITYQMVKDAKETASALTIKATHASNAYELAVQTNGTKEGLTGVINAQCDADEAVEIHEAITKVYLANNPFSFSAEAARVALYEYQSLIGE